MSVRRNKDDQLLREAYDNMHMASAEIPTRKEVNKFSQAKDSAWEEFWKNSGQIAGENNKEYMKIAFDGGFWAGSRYSVDLPF